MISPIFESQADEKTKEVYQQIKQAFSVAKPPIFFCYLAPFYEYFSYIATQIITNLKNEKFIEIINETRDIILKLIKDNLKKSEETNEFLNRFKHSPQFFYFQKDLEKIFDTNLKLTFIFIALREAVKGWAIAAIEKDLLPSYLQLCRNDFYLLLKKDEYVFIRLEIEKIILRFLSFLPELIVSPVNLVIEMTKKYENYPELLYLLSEHFPTTVVQRLMFSGYMKE
jgi:hypothetical protein